MSTYSLRRNVLADGLTLGLAAAMLTGCATPADSLRPTPGSSPSDHVISQLPTYNMSADAPVPAGIVDGRLIDQRDCVLLQQSDGSKLMIVWPAGFRRDGESIFIDTSPITHLGDDVQLTGGSFTEENYQVLQQLLNSALPPDCRIGTYWLTVEVRPTNE